MRHFQCSIAGLMALVGLAALDCMAIRAPLSGRPIVAAMLLLGGLPMANLLTIGLLPLLFGRPGSRGARPSVVGFEVVGWATLLLYASACKPPCHHLPDMSQKGTFRDAVRETGPGFPANWRRASTWG